MGRQPNGAGCVRYLPERKRWRVEMRFEGKRESSTWRTEAEALREVDRINEARRAGVPLDYITATVGDYLDRWIAERQASMNRFTWREYASVIRLHLKPALGHHKLSALTTAHVKAWLDAQLKTAKPTTVTQRMAVLRAALQDAYAAEAVTRNVAALVRGPRIEPTVVPKVGADDITRLLDAFSGDRLEALFVLCLLVPIRQGEALGLTWENVDLERGKLTIAYNLRRYGGEVDLKRPKNKSSERTLDLPSPVVEALREHRVRHLKERLAAGELWEPPWVDGKPVNFVFPNLHGGALHPNLLRKRFHACLKRAGLEKRRPYDLRHAAISALLTDGVPLFLVSRAAGHQKLATTSDKYGHLVGEGFSEVARAMERLVKKKETG